MTTNILNFFMASDQQNKKTKNNLFLEPDPNSPELVLKSLVTIPDSDHTNIEIEAHAENSVLTSTSSTSTPILTYSQALTEQRTS